MVQITYMQDIKAAFLAQDALAVVAALVSEPLSKLPQALPRQEELLLQLVITFLRNLIAVPDRTVTAGAQSKSRGCSAASSACGHCNSCTGLLHDQPACLLQCPTSADHLLITAAGHGNCMRAVSVEAGDSVVRCAEKTVLRV